MVILTGWPLPILMVLVLIFSSTPVYSQPQASVDRSTVAVDESLTLTLRIDRTGSISAPDLSGIRSNFHIVNTTQSTNHSFINGKSESVTLWQITIIPKQVGQLLIPALIIDGEKTQPIEIDVRPNVPTSDNNLSPVYLESEVDNNKVYVQQQLIYTLRIFQSIQLDNMNISEPEFDQAAIKKLSQNSYQRRIKNTPYRVHELRYAIFPQQSGELIIPEIVFSANEAIARRSVFSLPGQGRAIRKMSQQHTIIVKDIPTRFKGATWLPAKSIKLEQTWSSSPDTIRVGESITRSISIKADGLLDSQLPPIDFPELSGAKFYPDKGETHSSETEQGVVSLRTDSTALIPTKEGTLTLPEIRLTWWDTNANTLREAVIAKSVVTVKPTLDTPAPQNSTAIDHSQDNITTTPVNVVSSSNAIYWQAACALLTLAWLFTLFLWLSSRQRLSNNPLDTAETSNHTEINEKQAYKILTSVCHNNNIQETRHAVIQWAQTYWPEQTIHSLKDIQKHCQHRSLINTLSQLDNALYGNNSNTVQWNGEGLLATIEQLKKNNKQQSNYSTELVPLYPN